MDSWPWTPETDATQNQPQPPPKIPDCIECWFKKYPNGGCLRPDCDFAGEFKKDKLCEGYSIECLCPRKQQLSPNTGCWMDQRNRSHVNISLPKMQRCTKEEWDEMKKKLPKKTILQRIKEWVD